MWQKRERERKKNTMLVGGREKQQQIDKNSSTLSKFSSTK